jgi:prophage tail gpP-like protein
MTAPVFTSIPLHDIALVIGGDAYLGWTELSVERGIDSLCGNFALTLTAREGTGLPEFPIADGAACAIALGGRALITGYVDRVARSLDAETRSLTVSGRDKACDLVDCSALNAPGSWSNASLETIARALADPFGVTLAFNAATGKPLRKFALQPGETAFAAIERLCRYRGLIAWSDGVGGITIGNPDPALRCGAVIEGENLLSIESEFDQSQRYSSYVIKGQASGGDSASGKAVAHVKGTASDPGVLRNRPLLIIGEEQSDAKSLRVRAEWEAQTRAARSRRHVATVPGWFVSGTGTTAEVWQPGARTRAVVHSHGLDSDLLIERVTLKRDAESGTTTELTLVAPEAWLELPEAEAK